MPGGRKSSEQPSDEFTEALVAFASDLTFLRIERGNPSYRQIEALAPKGRPLSASAVSEALNGKRLPRLDFLIALVGTLLAFGDPNDRPVRRDDPRLREWRSRWEKLEFLRVKRKRAATLDRPGPEPERSRHDEHRPDGTTRANGLDAEAAPDGSHQDPPKNPFGSFGEQAEADFLGRAAASGESRDKTTDGLGAAATQRQHALGKLTVRERIDLLVDDGSFTELNPLQGNHLAGSNSDREVSCTDGVVTGWGTVEGRAIFVYGQDFRVFGGALGEAHAAKIHDLMDMALTAGAPLVSLVDGGGARIHEGLSALAGYGGIFRRTVQASGVIPQISAVLGPAAGGAACAPALTDFVFMVRTVSQMYISGPDVVRAVTGESTTVDALGGADVHTEVSGTAGFAFDDERTCLRAVRRLLSLLPSNSGEVPPVVPCLDSPDRQCEVLLELVPSDSNHAYDVRAVIEEIVDDKDFLEIQERWAANVVCGLSRLGGHVVGIVANQPARLAGVLDTDATEKAARFVQFCDAFNIPLITLVDVPGFLPGLDQEHNGLIRDTAKLLYAYCNATVPRVQLVMRKAYGSAYIVMDSRSIGSDLSFAWPTNEMAVMDPDGAVNAIFRRRIAEADDPEAMHREMVEKYERDLMHPHYTAQQGLVNDVIDPARTREVLIRSLAVLRTKRDKRPVRKHGNLPL